MPGLLSRNYPVEEIFLPRAPLALALAQVRFPQMPELTDADHIGRLRNLLITDFPIFREQRGVGIVVSAAGVTEGSPEQLLRFSDRTEEWTITVSQNFYTLSTVSYSTREDFCSRFDNVTRKLSETLSPVVFDRLGIRYINRLGGSELDELGRYVTSAFLGLTPAIASPATVRQSFTQALLHLEQAEISARWGLLPQGTVIDPALPPLDATSWILDVDTFQERKGEFEVEELGRRLREYADAAYRFFRLAVTDDLLKKSGSTP